MSRRSLIAFAVAFFLAMPFVHAADRPTNVVIILIDDMGQTDLSCYGSTFYETPNIDRLATQGMRFTQAYSACTVCSPTRASLLTGLYPARLHVTDWIAGHKRPFAKLNVPDWTMHLDLEQPNLAKTLKSHGYATASIGKWHLGGPEYYPDKQGFDLNVGGTNKGQPPSYFSPYKIPTLPNGPDGEFLSDRLTQEAIKFITANREKPFFLYLPHFAVHQPIDAKPAVIEKYKKKADPKAPQHNAVYAGLVESVDDSVGTLVKALDDLKLTDNTLVIFASDNGGLLPVTSNLGLRAGKGSAYEGGVRTPLIVRWPGHVKAGTISDTPVITADYYPTILAALGLNDVADHHCDGVSILPVLTGAGPLARTALYWHYPHYHPGGASPHSVVREGNLKLIEFFEDHHLELYDLKADPLEKQNLAAERPQDAQRLQAQLQKWRTDVGAQYPTPNPNYDPAKDAAKGAKGKREAVMFSVGE